MLKPFSIKIFLEEGTADGVRLVEKSNWDGAAVVCPRPRYADVKKRKEYQRPGVYLLVGQQDDGPLPRVYIGEGDPLQNRIDDHFIKKGFWTSVLAFTSSAGRLNKAHVQHLEARLVELASQAKRYVLDNANTPQRPSLTAADCADAELFLDEMLLVLPVLGVTAFEQAPSHSSNTIQLQLEGKGIRATAFLSANGMVVKAGSAASASHVKSVSPSILALREQLKSSGVLVQDGEQLRFVQDYEFGSPSASASTVLGNNTNGRIAWKDAGGHTLADIEANAVAK